MAVNNGKLSPNDNRTLRRLPELIQQARFEELHELADRILNSPDAKVGSRWNAAFFSLLAHHVTGDESAIESCYQQVEELYPQKQPETANREYFLITARIIAELNGLEASPSQERIIRELDEQRDARTINPLIQMVIEWAFFREDPDLLRKAIGHLVTNKKQEADHYEYHRGNFFLTLLENRSAEDELSRMIDTRDYPVQSYELSRHLIPLALERGAITRQEAEVLKNTLTEES